MLKNNNFVFSLFCENKIIANCFEDEKYKKI